MRFPSSVWRLALLASLFWTTASFGDEPNDAPPDATKARNANLLALYRAHAGSYRMEVGPQGAPLSLQAEPVFIWENRARVATPRIQTGAVFVWTRDGRAEVIGTVFSQTVGDRQPVLFHEYHSLATEQIQASNQEGVLHWRHTSGGLNPRPVPAADPPAANRSLRLIQMRRQARRFSGYSINYDEKRWNLALLPRPLHRMEKQQAEILDGAVFTLMSTAGTDPEIMIVIEARKRDDQWQWHYSVCRFTDLKTWVSLGQRVVWSFENGSQGPYIESGMNDPYRFSSEGPIELPGE